MKYSIFLVILIAFCHCKGKKNAEEKSTAIVDRKETPYDTLKFNRRLALDTAGCGWLWADREIIDTLNFERAVVQSNVDTFLTYRHRKLWTCNVPSFVMIPGDTLLISGYVYVIYSTETSGYRTWVTEIAYQER